MLKVNSIEMYVVFRWNVKASKVAPRCEIGELNSNVWQLGVGRCFHRYPFFLCFNLVFFHHATKQQPEFCLRYYFMYFPVFVLTQLFVHPINVSHPRTLFVVCSVEF